MSTSQINGIIITGLLSVVDGYDLLATAFVAPALATEFGVGLSGLGIVLSSGLTGTLFGAFLLAPFADAIGRKPIVLISLLIMVIGMAASAVTTSLTQLAATRLFAGVGIGAMMVIVNPIAAELANERRRPFAIAIKSIGFPIGGVLGGLVAALTATYGWQIVFIVGAAAGLALVPVVIWLLPESIEYLMERQPRNAVGRINAILTRFGHRPIDRLPAPPDNARTPYLAIFQKKHIAGTLCASAFSFLTWVAIFFFLSWQTQMLVAAGLDPTTAAAISGSSSFSGAVGVLFFAFIASRVDERRISVISVLGLGLSLILFGLVPASLWWLALAAALVGAAITGATVALYVVTTSAFESRMLATGSGFVIGVGRIGSAVAPAFGAILFDQQFDRAWVTGIMGAAALIAALIMWKMPRRASK
ncbi:MFS transporter [Mesorhizobium sp. SB112]|uniref:MFS transporter n=1 Tax=Mesorhizobium sp. SB112 TaxID=3151853 RepID=UPI003266DF43